MAGSRAEKEAFVKALFVTPQEMLQRITAEMKIQAAGISRERALALIREPDVVRSTCSGIMDLVMISLPSLMVQLLAKASSDSAGSEQACKQVFALMDPESPFGRHFAGDVKQMDDATLNRYMRQLSQQLLANDKNGGSA